MMRNTKCFALLALGGKRILGVSVVALLGCSLLGSCVRISTTTTTSKTESYYKTDDDSSYVMVVTTTDNWGNKTTKKVKTNVVIDGVAHPELRSEDEVKEYLSELSVKYKMLTKRHDASMNGNVDEYVEINVETEQK